MVPKKVIIQLGQMAVVCGILFIIGGFFGFLGQVIPALPILALTICFAVGSAFAILGYTSLYLVQAESIGKMGFLAYVFIIFGSAFHFQSFFNPSGVVLYIVGLLLLALVNPRGKVFPDYLVWGIFLVQFFNMAIGYLSAIPAGTPINHQYLNLIITTFQLAICPILFGILMILAGKRIEKKLA